MNWIKRLVAGKELDTLARYRAAVEAHKASSSHDAMVTAWAIYSEAEGIDQQWADAVDHQAIDRRSHPFK